MSPTKPSTFLIVNDLYHLYINQRSAEWCQRTYKKIKLANNLTKTEQLITVRMYCDYMGQEIDEVQDFLNGTHPMSNVARK